MKKQYFLNANIVDPANSVEELGGLIINENGKIEAIGKKVNKNNMLIEEITQPYFSKFPYSKIIYEHYGELSGYLLPKKITIFNSEGDSKAILQIQSLKVNPYLLNFNLNIPSSIPIERL